MRLPAVVFTWPSSFSSCHHHLAPSASPYWIACTSSIAILCVVLFTSIPLQKFLLLPGMAFPNLTRSSPIGVNLCLRYLHIDSPHCTELQGFNVVTAPDHILLSKFSNKESFLIAPVEKLWEVSDWVWLASGPFSSQSLSGGGVGVGFSRYSGLDPLWGLRLGLSPASTIWTGFPAGTWSPVTRRSQSRTPEAL